MNLFSDQISPIHECLTLLSAALSSRGGREEQVTVVTSQHVTAQHKQLRGYCSHSKNFNRSHIIEVNLISLFV